MKLEKPNAALADMSTEQLIAAVDGIRALSVSVIEYLSDVLAELRKRRVQHDFFSDRILSFWQEISGKTLAAEAAIGLANRPMIKAVLPLTLDEQIEVAHGKEIAVATPEGSTYHMPIHRMDGPTIRRVFGPHGIRSIKAQTEMIRDDGKVERHGSITVDRDHGKLRIGNQTFTPDQFDAAFLALGFMIVPARNVPRPADTLSKH